MPGNFSTIRDSILMTDDEFVSAQESEDDLDDSYVASSRPQNRYVAHVDDNTITEDSNNRDTMVMPPSVATSSNDNSDAASAATATGLVSDNNSHPNASQPEAAKSPEPETAPASAQSGSGNANATKNTTSATSTGNAPTSVAETPVMNVQHMVSTQPEFQMFSSQLVKYKPSGSTAENQKVDNGTSSRAPQKKDVEGAAKDSKPQEKKQKKSFIKKIFCCF